MEIKFQKVHPDAKTPTYGYPGDAGLDLYACEDMVIKPGERKGVPTGIKIEIPYGYTALVWDKGSVSVNKGLTTIAGVFDFGYRGEYDIFVLNIGTEDCLVKKGDKIAQILIQPVVLATLVEDILDDDTPRGTGRLGSTGSC